MLMRIQIIEDLNHLHLSQLVFILNGNLAFYMN